MPEPLEHAALAVIAASLTPGVEPRYALLVGLALGLSPLESLALSIAGVAVLGLTLAAAVEAIIAASRRACGAWRSRLNPACIYVKAQEASAERLKGYVEKWGLIGLAVFVALPLPATGMYTGAAAAALLGIRGRRLLAALALGGAASVAITGAAAMLGLALWEGQEARAS